MYNVSRAASDFVVLNLLCPFGRHVVFISFLTVTNNYILYIVCQLESPLDKLLFRITTVSAKHYIVLCSDVDNPNPFTNVNIVT